MTAPPTLRYRIERAEFEPGVPMWDLATYEDGRFVSASCYGTFAEAWAEYDARTRVPLQPSAQLSPRVEAVEAMSDLLHVCCTCCRWATSRGYACCAPGNGGPGCDDRPLPTRTTPTTGKEWRP